MVATYTSIASEFKNQTDGPLVLTAYQLGYSVALTVVSKRFPLRLPLWGARIFNGWLRSVDWFQEDVVFVMREGCC